MFTWDKNVNLNGTDKWDAEQYSFNQTEEHQRLIAMTNEEYDKFMCERFPIFFQNRSKSKMESCMYWGFEIGSGWFPVLYELCVKLELICKPYNVELAFSQIKEKYGSLCAYNNIINYPENTPEEVFNIIEDLVREYQNKSYKICANTGQYYENKMALGWIYDVCPEELIKGRPEMSVSIIEECDRLNVIREISKNTTYSKLTNEELKTFLEKINNK